MKKLSVIFGAIITLLFVFTVQNSAGATIHACVNNNNGNIRVVSGPGDCKKNEGHMTWNDEGPQGPQGDQGPPGEDGAPGQDIEAREAINKMTSAKRVFITSEVYKGNLGGLEGADLKCQNAANYAGLEGVWKAWLSAGNRGDVIIAGRFSRHLGYYTLVTGMLWGFVADPIYGDFPHALYAGIRLDENGNYVGGQNNVWTSTSTYPTVGGFGESMCRNPDVGNLAWTSDQSTEKGHIGSSTGQDETWQDAGEESCDQLNHLYCFEQ